MVKKNFKTGFDGLLGDTSSSIRETKKDLISIDEVRATFIVRTDQLEQIKAISYWDRKKIKEVLGEALEFYINNYKKKNGEIKTPQ